MKLSMLLSIKNEQQFIQSFRTCLKSSIGMPEFENRAVSHVPLYKCIQNLENKKQIKSMKAIISLLNVASRGSPLAIAQVEEVHRELKIYYPHIEFSCRFIETKGDKDQTTPLRSLNKTDFFTKEVDEMLLSNMCHIAIHSAKDLPDPLTKGLSVIAITKGVDPSDSLVLQAHINLSNLPQKPLIATSSLKREESIKAILPQAIFTDIRGTIGQRLKILDDHKIDGVVIAEAALIRLKLTSRNRVRLPGTTTPLQGQLAVVAHAADQEMQELFRCIDTRI